MTETRTLEDGKDWLLQRLEKGIHPVDEVDPEAAREAIEGLGGLDPESWTSAWGAAAERFAASAEAATDPAAEREAWLDAYRFAFLARYPTLNHPLKHEWYDRTRDYFVRARGLDDPPLQVVTVPFEGREGEGDQVVFYIARPAGVERPPVVMAWGGIDTWKEEMRSRAEYFLELGFAMLLVDMPGIGQSPVLAGSDAERQWTPVFDWLASQDDLDGTRVATLGASFGGYWAMKLAYTHRERLRCRRELGRRHPHHVHAASGRRSPATPRATYRPDGRPRRHLRREDLRGLRRPLPRALAARPRLARPALRSDPARQRPPRPPERDRRHLPRPRARRPEDRPRSSRAGTWAKARPCPRSATGSPSASPDRAVAPQAPTMLCPPSHSRNAPVM